MSELNPIPFLAGVAKAVAARLSFVSVQSFLRRPRDAAGPSVGLKLDTRKWSPELLKQLEWRRFEEVCAAYYEALGFSARVSGAGADGGVDILLHEQGSERASSIARCRAWDAYRIGVKAVRELRSAMAVARINQGVLLTSGRFTYEAVALAGKENIQLIDGAGLLDKIAALPQEKALALLKFATQGDFVTPTCPACSIKMTSRQSTKEGRKFWGCRNYPACKQTFAGTANAPA
jgi:restriction system protein